MKQVKNNIKRVCIFLCALFALLAVYGGYSITVNGNRWFSSGSNTFVRNKKKDVIAGSILDRNGQVLAQNDAENNRIYHADAAVRRAMVHVVGDSQGNVNNGAESFMASALYGFQMSMPERIAFFFQGQKRVGDTVQLTLDSRLSAYASTLFPSGKAGAMVVMNYKTGEVLAEISLPQYDPQQITAQAKSDPKKPFYNRAVQGLYAPGSTFKIVTAASALENFTDAATRAYQCSGLLQVGERYVTDAGTDMAAGKITSHGQLTLLRAFQVSCNNTFAQIALNLGDQKLKKTAENFGFNDNFLFRDVVVENSQYPAQNRTEREIAWTGVGQSELTATPLHMCMVAAAVANEGVMMEPYTVLRTLSFSGSLRTQAEPRVYRTAMQPQTALTLKSYMRTVVTSGTGTGANIPGVQVCGKTGSAEVDTQENTNAWFVGFIDEEAHPYAVSIVVEDAGGGGSVAAPMARQVFQWMLNNGY
ncbi:MAG: penicillin-binding protein 2 [Clostridia bacterium]|nr:penicillin-binding protein 2 [Clostridia bacterium]